MDNEELKERRQALESKKNTLLTRLKRLDSQAKYKSYEARVLQTLLKGKTRPDARGLQRRLNMLEFKVETEATTLALERQLMKEIKKTQRELEEAITADRQFRKLAYLVSDLRECEKELNQIEHDLQETNHEIIDIEKSFHEEARKQVVEERIKRAHETREKRRKETHEQLKQESEPYMTKLEPTVTLEDICVIKKKDDKKDAE